MNVEELHHILRELVDEGRGHYTVYISLDDPAEEFGGMAREVSDTADWVVTDVGREDGEDAFIVLDVVPEL